EVRVVVEEAAPLGRAVLREAQDARRGALAHDELLLDEAHRPLGRLQERGVAERRRRVGQRADDERVPAREDLLVAERLRALLAYGPHRAARALEGRALAVALGRVHERQHRRAALLEVALRVDAPHALRGARRLLVARARGVDLGRRPHEELPLLALAV